MFLSRACEAVGGEPPTASMSDPKGLGDAPAPSSHGSPPNDDSSFSCPCASSGHAGAAPAGTFRAANTLPRMLRLLRAIMIFLSEFVGVAMASPAASLAAPASGAAPNGLTTTRRAWRPGAD